MRSVPNSLRLTVIVLLIPTLPSFKGAFNKKSFIVIPAFLDSGQDFHHLAVFLNEQVRIVTFVLNANRSHVNDTLTYLLDDTFFHKPVYVAPCVVDAVSRKDGEGHGALLTVVLAPFDLGHSPLTDLHIPGLDLRAGGEPHLDVGVVTQGASARTNLRGEHRSDTYVVTSLRHRNEERTGISDCRTY